MTQTNETTRQIINFLFYNEVFCWRQNTTGIPLANGGFRPTSKKGLPDIVAILKPYGTFVAIEIKIGKDRLRDEQFGFLENVKRMGGQALIVNSFEDFKSQWQKLKMSQNF